MVRVSEIKASLLAILELAIEATNQPKNISKSTSSSALRPDLPWRTPEQRGRTIPCISYWRRGSFGSGSCCFCSRKINSMDNTSAEELPLVMPLDLLRGITNDFSEERELGSGSYGKVYMGVYPDGEKIAVKKLFDMPGLDDKQFLNEFKTLTRLRNQNIVRLVGYCRDIQHVHVMYEGKLVIAERTHRVLCLEYMSNGSLDKYLSDECDRYDWHTGYRIIKGVCEGLKYLHNGLKTPIYHLDLKPANILLDENMVPRIADFGISRLFSDEQTRATISSLGTLGYSPPEFIRNNLVSNKFDIFSLGVVIIKIMAGRAGYFKSAEMSSEEFTNLVQENWTSRLVETANRRNAYSEQVKICITIGLSCVQEDRHKRPTIQDIVYRLEEAETECTYAAMEDLLLISMVTKSKRVDWVSGLQVRDELGRLQIIKNNDLEELQELGSRTFGTVYHGIWGGSDVAIKRISDKMPNDFWNEASNLAYLHHPNVVAFYGVVLDGPEGSIATVTEYMVNGSLRTALLKNSKCLDRRKRLIIAMDTAFGMEYLHNKNLVHFSLKSDNLLVDLRDPQRPVCKLKVCDLGLSEVKFQTLISGGFRGWLPWTAPELLNGSSSLVSEKVDVFSFGIVLWELLTGKQPYAELNYGSIIGGIASNTLRPQVPDSCDPEWRSLMEQCWVTEPSERPSFTQIAVRLCSMAATQNIYEADTCV